MNAVWNTDQPYKVALAEYSNWQVIGDQIASYRAGELPAPRLRVELLLRIDV